MKTLIYQYYRDRARATDGPCLDLGYEYHVLSRKSVSKYAEKCGSDYKFLDHDFGHAPFYGIFLPFIEGWCEEYDAICFMDSDILATNNFDNVFDHIQDDRINYVQMKLKSRNQWLDAHGGHGNSGFVVFPRKIYSLVNEYFNRNIENPPGGHMGGWDQLMINLFVIEQQKFNGLPERFNWHLGRWDQEPRFDQTLIHYHRKYKGWMKDEFNDERIMK